MNYKDGLESLKQASVGKNWFEDFNLFEARLLENLRDESRYGSSEGLRSDRARIVSGLNTLSLTHLSVSFNDLCLGVAASPQTDINAVKTKTGVQNASNVPSTSIDRVKLREMIAQYFNEGELQNLCFDLEINYENLSGPGFGDKVRNLILYCSRHERIHDLWSACRTRRPNTQW